MLLGDTSRPRLHATAAPCGRRQLHLLRACASNGHLCAARHGTHAVRLGESVGTLPAILDSESLLTIALGALTAVAVARLHVASAALAARGLTLARAILLDLLGTLALRREVVLRVDTRLRCLIEVEELLARLRRLSAEGGLGCDNTMHAHDACTSCVGSLHDSSFECVGPLVHV